MKIVIFLHDFLQLTVPHSEQEEEEGSDSDNFPPFSCERQPQQGTYVLTIIIIVA